jgi:hypothetical protein
MGRCCTSPPNVSQHTALSFSHSVSRQWGAMGSLLCWSSSLSPVGCHQMLHFSIQALHEFNTQNSYRVLSFQELCFLSSRVASSILQILSVLSCFISSLVISSIHTCGHWVSNTRLPSCFADATIPATISILPSYFTDATIPILPALQCNSHLTDATIPILRTLQCNSHLTDAAIPNSHLADAAIPFFILFFSMSGPCHRTITGPPSLSFYICHLQPMFAAATVPHLQSSSVPALNENGEIILHPWGDNSFTKSPPSRCQQQSLCHHAFSNK